MKFIVMKSRHDSFFCNIVARTLRPKTKSENAHYQIDMFDATMLKKNKNINLIKFMEKHVKEKARTLSSSQNVLKPKKKMVVSCETKRIHSTKNRNISDIHLFHFVFNRVINSFTSFDIFFI